MTKKAKVGIGIAGVVTGPLLLVAALLFLGNGENQTPKHAGIVAGAILTLAGASMLTIGLRVESQAGPENMLRFNRDSGTAVVDPGKTIGPIGLNQDFSETLLTRGNARASKGDFEGAIDDYSGALQIKPQRFDIYRNRGSARLFNGDMAGAIADYNQAITIKPDYVEAYLNRAAAHAKAGNTALAAADYQKVVELDPSGPNGQRAQQALSGLQ